MTPIIMTPIYKFVIPKLSKEHRDALDHMLAGRDPYTEISTIETFF